MNSTPEFLFHVTHERNAASIVTNGLDPRIKFPARKDKRSWFVTEGRLSWALAHVSVRLETPVSRLSVFPVETRLFAVTYNDGVRFRKMGGLQGVYWTDSVGIIGRFDQFFSAEYCLMKLALGEHPYSQRYADRLPF